MTSHDLSRRGFVAAGAGALAMIASASGAPQDEPSRRQGRQAGARRPRQIQFGLQLYSVRDDCGKDLPGTLAKVANMGYTSVEFAGYYGRTAKDMRKLLDDNGLTCCGTHTGIDTLLGNNLAGTIEYNQILGNKFLIVPGLAEKYRSSRQAWLETAKLFNELAEKVKPAGMLVGYHNHSIEFKPMDGEMPWDTFYGNTVADVVMQLDTGNACHGGADPLPFLYKYPGRAKSVHIKAYSKTDGKALIGEDDINWAAFFALCRAVGGTEAYIVEHESYAYPPLECVERCIKNLQAMRLGV